MDPFQAINGVASVVTTGIRYLQYNAWFIIMLLAVGYVVKSKALDPYLESRQYRPEAIREADYKDEIRRIRLKQQEETIRRAAEAAKERKEKENKENARKNQIFDPKKQDGDAPRLGMSSGKDYSPMQPSSGSTRGYKPVRRVVDR